MRPLCRIFIQLSFRRRRNPENAKHHANSVFLIQFEIPRCTRNDGAHYRVPRHFERSAAKTCLPSGR